MWDFFWRSLMNHSILIPVILIGFRFRYLDKDYLPFLLMIFLGACNEVLSLILIIQTGSNTVNANIYVLLEFGLILYQFYIFSPASLKRILGLGILGFIIWMTDNLMIHTLERNNSLFRAAYSFIIVLLSANRINKIVIFEKVYLWRNAALGLCFIFSFYFSCKAFVETFNLFSVGLNVSFLQNLWKTMAIVNFISNFLYALVILWIPKNQNYMSSY